VFVLSSFWGEDLGDIGQAVKHVQLLVAALKQCVVGRGDDLWNLSFFDVFNIFGRLSNVEIQELVEELLTVVALVDYTFGLALNVGICGTSSANDKCNHHDCLAGHLTRDAIDVFYAQTVFFSKAGAGLQHVDATTKITIGNLDQPIDDRFGLQIDRLCFTDTCESLLLGLLRDRCKSKLHATRG